MGTAGRLQGRAHRGEAKKLIEAAERLFHGCTDTDKQSEALAALNIEASPDLLESDPTLDIWPENWGGLCLFLRLETQWRYAQRPVGMGASVGVPAGLDYGRLEFWLELEAVPRAQWPQAVDAMQALEQATLRLMRAQG